MPTKYDPRRKRGASTGAGVYSGYSKNFKPVTPSTGSKYENAVSRFLFGEGSGERTITGPDGKKYKVTAVESGAAGVVGAAAQAVGRTIAKGAAAKPAGRVIGVAGKTAKPVKGGPTPTEQLRDMAMAERRKLAGVTNKKNGKDIPSGAASRTGDKFLKPTTKAEKDLQKKNAGSLKPEIDKARELGGAKTEKLMQPDVGRPSTSNARAVTGKSRGRISDAELEAQRVIDEKKLKNARAARRESDARIRAQGDKPGGKPPIYPQPERNYGRTVTKNKTFKNAQGEKFKAEVQVEAAKLKPKRSKYKTQAGFDRAMSKWTEANKKWLAENKVSPAAADRAIAAPKPAASKGGSGKPAATTPAKPAEKPTPAAADAKITGKQGKYPKKPTKAQREQAARDMEAYRGQNKAAASKPVSKPKKPSAKKDEPTKPKETPAEKPKLTSTAAEGRNSAAASARNARNAAAAEARTARNTAAAAARADRATKANAAAAKRDTTAAAARARVSRTAAAATARRERTIKANAANAARNTAAAKARDARNAAASAARADRSTKANAAAAARNADAAAARAKNGRRFPKKTAAVAGAGAAGVMALGLIPDRKNTATDSKKQGGGPSNANKKAFADSSRAQARDTRTREGIIDNKGRKISRDEFEARKAFRSRFGLDKMTEAQRIEWRKKNKSAWKAEVERRSSYRKTEGKKRFGKAAVKVTNKAKTRRTA